MVKQQKKFKFEEGINKLEKIVETLENPDTGLDESIEIFSEGMDILNKCNEKLSKAELKINELTKTSLKNNLDDETPF